MKQLIPLFFSFLLLVPLITPVSATNDDVTIDVTGGLKLTIKITNKSPQPIDYDITVDGNRLFTNQSVFNHDYGGTVGSNGTHSEKLQFIALLRIHVYGFAGEQTIDKHVFVVLFFVKVK